MPHRIGLIGAGRWGKNFIRILQQSPHGKLVAIGSRNLATQSLVSKECLIFTHPIEFIDLSIIDGLIIASPPSTHFNYLKEAMTKGIPTLVEKPLTTQFNECIQLKRLEETTGTSVLVDHIHLFHSGYKILKNLFKEKLKTITRIDSIGGSWGPFRADYNSLWDYGAHDISLCIDLLEELPIQIFAEKVKMENIDDHQAEIYTITLEYRNNLKVNIRVGNGFKNKIRQFSVFTREEYFILDDLSHDCLKRYSIHDENSEEIITVMKNSSLESVLELFLKELKKPTSSLWGIDLGVKVVKILTACEESIHERRIIKLSED